MRATPAHAPAIRQATFAVLALSVLALPVALGGCAGSSATTTTADAESNDPYESTNRFFYKVDDTLVRYTIKPVSDGYVYVVPAPVRTGIHNVLTNLSSPVLFVDDVSQGKPRRAGDTFMRFLINSTAGGLGTFDVAAGWGYPGHASNFGVTLALWGVPSGPYLYLPFLGPSSPRALTGFAVDSAADPFSYVPHGYGLLTLNWARYGFGLVDTYSRAENDLEHVKAGALDPYATFRSLYVQHTQSQIDNVRNDNRATPPAWDAAH